MINVLFAGSVAFRKLENQSGTLEREKRCLSQYCFECVHLLVSPKWGHFLLCVVQSLGYGKYSRKVVLLSLVVYS